VTVSNATGIRTSLSTWRASRVTNP
jgi:hypothetical protein